MASNFTFQDTLGVILAFSLYPFVFVFPGYVVGWMLNLFDFKKRTSVAQLIMGIAFSSIISPTLFFLAFRIISSRFAIFLSFILAAVAVAIFIFEMRRDKPQPQDAGYKRLAIIFVFLWLVLSVVTLVDFQIADRLYYSNNAYDLTARVSVINAITRTGVPPVNPSYYPGHETPLNFLYYYWYVLASIVDQIGGRFVSAYQSIVASISWAGILLFAAMATYLRVRDNTFSSLIWKKVFIAMQFFVVSGLDFVMLIIIMPNFKRETGFLPFEGHIEGWNMPVASWMNTLAWVPHHLTAALACVLAMALLISGRNKSFLVRFYHAVIMGVAFSSAFGLSLWVMFVFAIFWIVWAFFTLVRQQDWQCFFDMFLGGLFGVLFSVPFLAGLFVSATSSLNDGFPMTFYARTFVLTDFLSGLSPIATNLVNFIFLPLNYLFEFGVFSFIALLWIQGFYKKKPESVVYHEGELILVIVTTCLLSFLRSNLFVVNDLGIRGWLPMQFLLVVWSADIVIEIVDTGNWITPKIFRNINGSKILGIVMGGMLIIGVLTTGLEVFTLRAWSMLVDMKVAGFPNGISPDAHLGERTYFGRLAYNYITDHIRPGAIIQNSPLDFHDRPSGLYGTHQMVISDRTPFGIPSEIYNDFFNDIGAVFREKEDEWGPIDSKCEKYSIDILVIKDTDVLWRSLRTLKKERLPLYENNYYAIYSCGRYADSP